MPDKPCYADILAEEIDEVIEGELAGGTKLRFPGDVLSELGHGIAGNLALTARGLGDYREDLGPLLDALMRADDLIATACPDLVAEHPKPGTDLDRRHYLTLLAAIANVRTEQERKPPRPAAADPLAGMDIADLMQDDHYGLTAQRGTPFDRRA